MKVLLLGGTGRLGAQVRAALEREHVAVNAPTRTQLDLAAMKTPEVWRPWLGEVDVIVHAAGWLREEVGSSHLAQLTAARSLFFAAFTGSVRRVVHVSCAGADEHAGHGFHAAKGAADAFLRILDIDSTIIRPGALYAESPGRARLFHPLALTLEWPGALPMTRIEHVVTTIVNAVLAAPRGMREVIEQTEPQLARSA